MSDAVIIVIAVAVLAGIITSAARSSRIITGGIYSVVNGPGRYGVVKVLAVDRKGVHLRLYRNSYDRRPSRDELGVLELGKIHEDKPAGIGHFPASKMLYFRWRPKFIISEGVTEEELEGYRYWLEGGGAYWDS